MITPKARFRSLISKLSAEDKEQLRDDPAGFDAAGDGGVIDAPTETMRMGAGPMGPMTGTGNTGEKAPEPPQIGDILQKFDDDDELTFDDVEMAEALILPNLRPAVLVQDNAFHVQHPKWRHLNDASSPEHANILAALPSVGRINVPSNWSIPYAGTGFIVSDTLLMTNRHVAELFADGVGEHAVSLKHGASVHIDFLAEHGDDTAISLRVDGLRMIHPFWDMALLEVEGLPAGRGSLSLSQVAPETIRNDEVAVIGYPAFDPRNDGATQHRLFNRIYDVKRMMPGLNTNRARVRSFDNIVRAAGHDASTLGGASGSAVVHLISGDVIGLHFGGLQGRSNFAVPTSELAQDPRVARTNINFVPKPPIVKKGAWQKYWAATETTDVQQRVAEPDQTEDDTGQGQAAVPVSVGAGGLSAQISTSADGQAALSLNVPLKLTVGFDLPDGAGSAPAGAPDAFAPATEKKVEPVHDDDYSFRPGYDPNFLGIPVPMPIATNEDDLSKQQNGDTELRYYNFSLIMNAKRRLAQITACNIDAAISAKEPESGFLYSRKALNGFTSKNDREKWFVDPRIPAADQLPDKFYNADRKAFDKGHLVRREAVAFGDSFADVQMANGDTFHATNCSPQVKDFNRDGFGFNGPWGKLENDILDAAETERCIVFSGPVFDENDREFHGRDDFGDTRVKIPARYWKMIVTRDGAALKTHAYILEQDLSDVAFEFAAAGDWTDHEIAPDELERLLGTVIFPHLGGVAEEKMSPAEWRDLVEDPLTSDEEVMEVSIVLEGAGGFDFRIAPNPDFVDVRPGDPATEDAMTAANNLSRNRRQSQFKLRTKLGNKQPVLVSEMDSWGQFPVLIKEVVDHLNRDYRVWSIGAAGDTAQNMVMGPKAPKKTEYMLALNEQRKHVKAFVFSAAGNDIIGEDLSTGRPVLTDLLKPFNGNPADIEGHINGPLLEEKLEFLRGVYSKVISDIRSDPDFKTLPILIHGYDYPFPYPWVNDRRRPVHAARDKWLGKPFAERGIQRLALRRDILKHFIDRLYGMLGEFSKEPASTKVWLVDCRGAMPNLSDWVDEIHGTSNGFRKVAKRFKAALDDADV